MNAKPNVPLLTETMLVERIVNATGPTGFVFPDDGIEPDQLAALLGNAEPEDIRRLIDMKLLGAVQQGWHDERVPAAEVLRFLSEHGELWFRVRLEKLIEETARAAGRSEAANEPTAEPS